MYKRQALSLAVLIPCVLYAAGIIAQFIININAWKAAGSDYRISPGLPSSQISEVVRALFHFPEGLIAIGVVVPVSYTHLNRTKNGIFTISRQTFLPVGAYLAE